MKIFKKKKDKKLDNKKLQKKTQKFVEDFAEEEVENPSLNLEMIMKRVKKHFNHNEMEFLATQFIIKSTIEILSEDVKQMEEEDEGMMYR